MTKEKSLKVIKESIFDKIRKFFNKLFGKEQNIEKIENAQPVENIENTNEQISLEERIEKENINLSEGTEEKFEEINTNLSRYLEKIQQEINKVEKANLENHIKEYHEEFAQYREKMAN
ncbi:MAG: hypothetical protein IJ223_04260 [Clostridia bacterium]|nr:hypothetical protein [Clostridia bacterium]